MRAGGKLEHREPTLDSKHLATTTASVSLFRFFLIPIWQPSSFALSPHRPQQRRQRRGQIICLAIVTISSLVISQNRLANTVMGSARGSVPHPDVFNQPIDRCSTRGDRFAFSTAGTTDGIHRSCPSSILNLLSHRAHDLECKPGKHSLPTNAADMFASIGKSCRHSAADCPSPCVIQPRGNWVCLKSFSCTALELRSGPRCRDTTMSSINNLDAYPTHLHLIILYFSITSQSLSSEAHAHGSSDLRTLSTLA